MTKEDFYERLIVEKEDEKGSFMDQAQETPKSQKPETLGLVDQNSLTKQFDDIERFYEFKRKNYGLSALQFQLFDTGFKQLHYAEFLKSGLFSRYWTTKHIFSILNEEFGEYMSLKGTHNDLERALKFENIPFQNAPKTIPKDTDFFIFEMKNYSTQYRRTDKKGNFFKHDKIEISTEFTIIKLPSDIEIGKIRYTLPHKSDYSDGYSDGSRAGFKFGDVSLRIFGNVIENEEQYTNLLNGLKSIRTTHTFYEKMNSSI